MWNTIFAGFYFIKRGFKVLSTEFRQLNLVVKRFFFPKKKKGSGNACLFCGSAVGIHQDHARESALWRWIFVYRYHLLLGRVSEVDAFPVLFRKIFFSEQLTMCLFMS